MMANRFFRVISASVAGLVLLVSASLSASETTTPGGGLAVQVGANDKPLQRNLKIGTVELDVKLEAGKMTVTILKGVLVLQFSNGKAFSAMAPGHVVQFAGFLNGGSGMLLNPTTKHATARLQPVDRLTIRVMIGSKALPLINPKRELKSGESETFKSPRLSFRTGELVKLNPGQLAELRSADQVLLAWGTSNGIQITPQTRTGVLQGAGNDRILLERGALLLLQQGDLKLGDLDLLVTGKEVRFRTLHGRILVKSGGISQLLKPGESMGVRAGKTTWVKSSTGGTTGSKPFNADVKSTAPAAAGQGGPLIIRFHPGRIPGAFAEGNVGGNEPGAYIDIVIIDRTQVSPVN